MRRLLLVLAVAGATLAALVSPSSGLAVASCDHIGMGPPALTQGSGGALYFTAQANIGGCAAKFYFITTLLVESGGVYNETGCNGDPVGSCQKVWPSTGGDCGGGNLFCAYTTVTRYPTWHPNLSICGYNYRARVYVYNNSGVELGRDTSVTERC